MDDRSITKLCAEAFGYRIADALDDVWVYFKWPDPDDNGGLMRFDPLNYGTQALELVDKFKLKIDPPDWGTPPQWVDWSVYHYSGGQVTSSNNENLKRAICECVAKIQQERAK